MDTFIALGSNLGNRRDNLRLGLRAMDAAGLPPAGLSSVWETEPVGTPAPEWFWNMVVRTSTTRAPIDLLDLLQGIERTAGRRRAERNGPRTLDLDLLLVGDLRVASRRLQLPHPRMWERRFVLEPLAEIAPRLHNPETGRTVEQHRSEIVDRSGARRLGPLYSVEAVPL